MALEGHYLAWPLDILIGQVVADWTIKIWSTHTTTQARQRRKQTTPTLDYEHVSGAGYYGDCPLPLDECPSAEKGLEAENNYIGYLDLSKYLLYLGQFLNILFTLPKNKLICPKNVGA